MKKLYLSLLAMACCMVSSAQVTIDDIVATYSGVCLRTYVPEYTYDSANDNYASSKKQTDTLLYDVIITKESDYEVKIQNLGNQGFTVTGTFDEEAQTITIAPKYYASAYTMCALPDNLTGDYVGMGAADITAPVVVDVNADGTMALDWCGAGKGYSNSQIAVWEYYKETLTRKQDNNNVEGTLTFTEKDEDGAFTIAKYVGTATMYKVDENSYRINIVAPESHYEENAAPANLEFTVKDDGTLNLTSGTMYMYPNDRYYELDLSNETEPTFTTDDNGGKLEMQFTGITWGDVDRGMIDDIVDVLMTFEWSTAVDGINNTSEKATTHTAVDKRFNLAGQCVGKDYKGLVIVGGKKIIQK